MKRLNKLIKKIRMEIIEFFKSLWSVSGAVLAFTIGVVILGAYVSFRNDKTNNRIDTGVIKIEKVANSTKKKMNKASDDLKNNLDLSQANFEKVMLANEQLLETNQKLSHTSSLLQKNFEETLKTLEAANKAKDEAIKAQTETLKSKNEVIGRLTGGDSYPEISLKKGGFHITVRGEYSIPDLRIIIYALPNYLNTPVQVTSDYLQNKYKGSSYIFPIYSQQYYMVWAGHMPGSIDIPNFNEYLPTNDGVMNGFDILLETKNKKWKQQIRLVSHKGKWEIADKLLEIQTTLKDNVYRNPEEISTKISENFPAIRTANTKTGKMMIYLTYNTQAYDTSKPSFDYIEYNDKNGAADREFDSL